VPIVEVKTRILAGGRVEIPATGLPEGSEATVRIVVEEAQPKRKISEILGDVAKEEPQPQKRTFLENLGGYKGGDLFRSAEEVDQYIREERDSWGD
jgi:hypothetical protein